MIDSLELEQWILFCLSMIAHLCGFDNTLKICCEDEKKRVFSDIWRRYRPNVQTFKKWVRGLKVGQKCQENVYIVSVNWGSKYCPWKLCKHMN